MPAWYVQFIAWCESHFFTCLSKKYLHMDCPGCGLQRSFAALLRGDLPGSVHLYPALVPMLALGSFTLLHLKFQFSYGAAVIKYLQIITGIIIAIFYIYKIVTLKAFL